MINRSFSSFIQHELLSHNIPNDLPNPPLQRLNRHVRTPSLILFITINPHHSRRSTDEDCEDWIEIAVLRIVISKLLTIA